jgi:hypothetical protein
VVILSAFVPTLIAQQFFEPERPIEQQLEEALEAEDYVPHPYRRQRAGTTAAES